ncbi:hypothetical protein F935_01554 [Acinetobacter calcoaceticus ANC 3811]|uniref:Uncharacterized protein n=1 Tax=Acinetobacter calcoaceticus ANC 3811 TaxID=1217690 RepID=R8Y3Y9_ACICA|nr:hypothetical protein [Acinetobacter calcoaceticus]EOQ63924.1 hypothetical protein F935_01554 [Acinetobacter calcoaceticus ANC 3811]
MSVLSAGDVVKHANYQFNFKIIKVSKQWATCEGMTEQGEKVVKDFSPEFLEITSRKPKMNITNQALEELEIGLRK